MNIYLTTHSGQLDPALQNAGICLPKISGLNDDRIDPSSYYSIKMAPKGDAVVMGAPCFKAEDLIQAYGTPLLPSDFSYSSSEEHRMSEDHKDVLAESRLTAISQSDAVICVKSEGKITRDEIFEIGFAAGIGLPIYFVCAKEVKIPRRIAGSRANFIINSDVKQGLETVLDILSMY